jgi:hypothetical protein
MALGALLVGAVAMCAALLAGPSSVGPARPLTRLSASPHKAQRHPAEPFIARARPQRRPVERRIRRRPHPHRRALAVRLVATRATTPTPPQPTPASNGDSGVAHAAAATPAFDPRFYGK